MRPARYDDIDWSAVRRVTIVPFADGGDVVLVDEGDRLAAPAGTVAEGEDVLLGAVSRIPLETAGFCRQSTHVVGLLGDDHAVFWVGGFRYQGNRRRHRRDAVWWTGPAGDAAARLRQQGDAELAAVVESADRARIDLTEEQFYVDNDRLLTRAYLAAPTAEGGSGFGGGADEWRAMRSVIVDAIDRDGTFLDVGCANGLLMESVVEWAAERGRRIEPFGVDYSAGLVAEARRRLPDWAGRIWTGNALTWTPPIGGRFDFVHTLLDLVPSVNTAALIDHLLDATVAAGGRLIVSEYGDIADERAPAAVLTRLGYRIDGVTRRREVPGRPAHAPSVWIVNC